MKRCKNRRTHNVSWLREGFVLLLVLVTLSVLVAMTGFFAWSVSLLSMSVDSRVCQSQNYFAINGALDVICQKIQRGQIVGEILEEGVCTGQVQIGSAIVFYKIWDEASKYRFTRKSTSVVPEFISALNIRIRSYESDAEAAFEAILFEDVFEVELEKLSKFYGPAADGKAVIDQVTLWSKGQVNINTAGEEVIRHQLRDLNNITVERLLQLRKGRTFDDIGQIAKLLGRDVRDERVLLLRLTTKVSTIAIRLMCQGQTLRTDGFAVLDLVAGEPRIRVWRGLPAMGSIPANRAKSEVQPLLSFHYETSSQCLMGMNHDYSHLNYMREAAGI